MNVKINEWWNLLRHLESTEENNPRPSTNMDTGQSLDLGKIMDFYICSLKDPCTKILFLLKNRFIDLFQ
jgi:hypothetical protein